MIKILHTADLHLDSAFSSLTPQKSEERKEGLRKTFKKMMAYAAEEKIDILLMPGDVFDSAFISRDTSDVLCSCFESLPCPVVIAPGNHDPYTQSSIYASGRLPKNVHVFTSEIPTHFDFPQLNLSVWGSAFTRERYEHSVLSQIRGLDPQKINILCQHADTRSAVSQYAPISAKDIAYYGFTYAALGHVHTPPEPVVITSPDGERTTTVAYSGCPEGRSFDEPGFGGALLVETDGKTTSLRRIQFSEKRYMVEELDVSGADSDDFIAETVKKLIGEKGYGEETTLRVILRGEISTNLHLDIPSVTSQAKGELYSLELRDRTLPCFDINFLENDFSLRGALYSSLSEKLSSSDEYDRRVAAEALKIGLAAIDGRRIM